MKKTAHIFDSYALLKLFQKEKGYEKISRLLEDIKKAGSVKYINAINLGEIIYTTKREFGDQKKLEALANIERLNFTILPAPNSLIFEAAEYKAQYSISYAVFCMKTTAVELDAVIVTGYPEFKNVTHLADIFWV